MTSKTIVGPWRKSSASGGQEQCVDVAPTADGGRAFEDTKSRESGRLFVGPDGWKAFRAHHKGEA